MTLKDIVKLVCEFIKEDDLLAKLNTEEPVYTAKEQKKLDLLTKCFNLVNQEIASDYLPFLKEESVDAQNVLNYSSLTEDVINIYQVKNRFGLPMRFKNYPNYIEFSGTAKKVVYSFLPEDLNLGDNISFYCGLSARVYAYGVASEFLLLQGLSADAGIWEERFKESLFVLSRRRGEHRLPKRRFL